jgi:hypothetical protein
MDDFTLTDAAVADKALQGVPDEQVDDELAKRNLPTAFDNLLKTYRALQQAMQQKSPSPPQTTVADDIMGLAALNNQLSSPVQNAISPQAAGAMSPQSAAPMPPEMMAQMASQAGAQQPPQPPMDQGLGGLDAGVMQAPQFADGGIVAFANRGEVEADNSEEPPTPITYNSYMEALGQTQTQAPISEQEDTKLPTSYTDYMTQMQQGLKDYKKYMGAREENLKNRPVYQAQPDPSVEEDRRRVIAQRLANEHDIDKDRWQSMVDMGLAWAESAAKGDDPLVSLVAGSKAGTTSLRKINDDYKKTQAALDKELIALDHAQYLAEETNRKDAYTQVFKIQDNIDALHSELLKQETELQKNAVTAAIQKEQADTQRGIAAQGRTTDFTRKLAIEKAALRELPENQGLTEAQIERKAYQNVVSNDLTREKFDAAQQADWTTRYAKEAEIVRKELNSLTSTDPDALEYQTTKDESIVDRIVRQRMSMSSPPSPSRPSSPAPAAAQTSAPRRVKYNEQGQKVG